MWQEGVGGGFGLDGVAERQGSLGVEACKNLSRRTEHDKRG